VQMEIVKPAQGKRKITKRASARANLSLMPVLAWGNAGRWDPDRLAVPELLERVLGPEGFLRPNAGSADLSAARELLAETLRSLLRREESIRAKFEGTKARLLRRLYSRRSQEIIVENNIRIIGEEIKQALRDSDVHRLLLSLHDLRNALRTRGAQAIPHRPVPHVLRQLGERIHGELTGESVEGQLRTALLLQKAQLIIDRSLAYFHFPFSYQRAQLGEYLPKVCCRKHQREPQDANLGRPIWRHLCSVQRNLHHLLALWPVSANRKKRFLSGQ